MEVSFWLLVSVEPLFLKGRQPYIKMITLLWSHMMALATPAAWSKSAGRGLGRWCHVSARQAPSASVLTLGWAGFWRWRCLQGKSRSCSLHNYLFLFPSCLAQLLSDPTVVMRVIPTLRLIWFWHIFSLTGLKSTSSIRAWFLSVCSVHITFINTVLTLTNLLIAYRNRVVLSKWPTKSVLNYLINKTAWRGLERWKPKRGSGIFWNVRCSWKKWTDAYEFPDST